VLVGVLVCGLGSTVVAEVQTTPWPLIRVPDPLARRAAIAALEAASTRLADPDCAKILTDFQDTRGQALSDGLSSLGVQIQDYLPMITFMDDTRHRRCASGVLVFTVPGSRVVRVCSDELKRIGTQQPEYVVASFIHEILHTLGLGENPPSSSQITARVLTRCGR